MIYYITYSKIPDGDASSIRSYNIAKIFMNCNMDVTLIGMGESEYLQLRKYDSLSYISLRVKGSDIRTRIDNYFGFKNKLKILLSQSNDIDALVLNLNTLPINTLLFLKKFSKKRGIKLFVDCCEWYSPEQFQMGKMSWHYIQNSYCVRKYIDNRTLVIAISKYLLSYFQQKKYQVINIPAILDVEKTRHNKRCKSAKTVLMYAGNAGKKDYLDVILTGLSLLSQEELAKIEFRIFGVTLNEIKNNFNFEIAEKVYDIVKCYGRVERNVILKNFEEADFTVLMRSSTQRYAKAGFPTKVVESLASATPVICNLTSDLAEYIEDGCNSVVVDGESAEDFSRAMKKVNGYSINEKEMMSNNARVTAEKHFDYRLYKNKIIELMGVIQ